MQKRYFQPLCPPPTNIHTWPLILTPCLIAVFSHSIAQSQQHTLYHIIRWKKRQKNEAYLCAVLHLRSRFFQWAKLVKGRLSPKLAFHSMNYCQKFYFLQRIKAILFTYRSCEKSTYDVKIQNMPCFCFLFLH